MVFAFSLVVVTYVLLTDENIEAYEQIDIEHGDTLWSLAENYRVKMDKQDWIALVKKVNHLQNENIVSGQRLLVPIEAGSQYIAMQTKNNQSIQIVSDNEWKKQ